MSPIRCLVNVDDGRSPLEADFVVVPRVGEMVDFGLRHENQRQLLRVTRVLHSAGAAAPSIELDVTSKML